MNHTGRRLARVTPVGPWAVLTAVGGLMAVVAGWNYWVEVQELGFGPGPIVAAAVGLSLSLGVVYAGVRLRESGFDSREGWVVVLTGLGGGLFTAGAYGLTLVVRVAEGRPLVEPAFPLLVVAAIGTLGGVVIGNEYVTTRRLTEEAREGRDAMAFTNSLLRHDVRNALQIITGRASRLRDHEDEQVKESAEAIVGQTEALDSVITEVESVVDVLTGETDGEVSDAAAVLEEAVTSVAGDRGDVTLETDLESGLRVEGGDALFPVFSNLVGNAVEHGGSSVHVRVSARREGDRAVVRVADDGPGIPEDERDRVFERGVSTDGGGHGLYVAETVVDRLGGDIRVEDSDLGGAAFVVEVPLVAAENGGTER